MDYFEIKEEKERERPKWKLEKKEWEEKEVLVKEIVFPEHWNDFFCSVYLRDYYYFVSEKWKKVMERYVPVLSARALIFFDKKRKEQKLYWRMEAERKEVLSLETEYYPDERIKRIVLKKEIDPNWHFFSIQTKQETKWICSLDVAESLLRRGLLGMEFEKIEREGKEWEKRR